MTVFSLTKLVIKTKVYSSKQTNLSIIIVMENAYVYIIVYIFVLSKFRERWDMIDEPVENMFDVKQSLPQFLPISLLCFLPSLQVHPER